MVYLAVVPSGLGSLGEGGLRVVRLVPRVRDPLRASALRDARVDLLAALLDVFVGRLGPLVVPLRPGLPTLLTGLAFPLPGTAPGADPWLTPAGQRARAPLPDPALPAVPVNPVQARGGSTGQALRPIWHGDLPAPMVLAFAGAPLGAGDAAR